jgi:hypothetical protein
MLECMLTCWDVLAGYPKCLVLARILPGLVGLMILSKTAATALLVCAAVGL